MINNVYQVPIYQVPIYQVPIYQVPIYQILIVTLLILFSIRSEAAYNPAIDELSWILKKAESDIQVFSAKVPGSAHRAVLSTTVVNSDIDSVAALIRDTKTCDQWVYRCKASYLVKSINEHEDFVHTISGLPFPLKDRDVIAHIKWQQNPETSVITATGMATSSKIVGAHNATRIEDAKMIWELTPLSSHKTAVRSFAHINPAGSLPAWLTNTFSIKGPFTTMGNLKGLLEDKM